MVSYVEAKHCVIIHLLRQNIVSLYKNNINCVYACRNAMCVEKGVGAEEALGQ